MARPRKPDLDAEEWLLIDGKGDRTAAGIVSAHRGANLGSISQAEAGRRRVSHEWVAQQRKKRQKTQPSENSEVVSASSPSENSAVTGQTGTRMASPTPGGPT